MLSGRGGHDKTGKPVGSWEGGMVANPAVVALRNGTLLMAYRGLEDRGMGMATPAAWDQPFERINGGAAVLGPASPAHTAVDEDPTMWISPGGTVQMILHQEGVGRGPRLGTACGAHAYSLDQGLSWTVAGTAYNASVGGTAFVRRERPQMLKGADGQPTHLFSGVVDRGTGYTHTIAVPLKTTDHLAQQPITCQPPELQIPIFHSIGNITRTAADALVRENINDANGVFKWKGAYHVFHQCCQNHWDHVVSRDLCKVETTAVPSPAGRRPAALVRLPRLIRRQRRDTAGERPCHPGRQHWAVRTATIGGGGRPES